MARIMKVRTIPRGYVRVSELSDFVRERGRRAADWFMALYTMLGSPQEGGKWSYLVRHDGVLIKVSSKDGDSVDYDVWVSPAYVLDAKRRRVRAVNIIARRLNEEGKVFMHDGDKLYYAVRRKNDELMSRKQMTYVEILAGMNASLTNAEKNLLYGSLSVYMTDAKEKIEKTISEIFGR